MRLQLTDDLVLRSLCGDDSAALGAYFDALSPESKSRFRPHPLTPAAARDACTAGQSTTLRLVIEKADCVIAYFVVEPEVPVHEAARYRAVGIELESGKDYLFAPSVADAHQDRGIASLAMPHLMRMAREAGARSLVLMGGTQATNQRALAFYEKFGFERHGGYQTDVYNHDMRRALEG